MSEFGIESLAIQDVKLITPFYREDNRGFFMKTLEKDVYAGFGLQADIFEDFESYSHGGVIRGLHFQTKNPQIKIVRAIMGTVHDVAVDLRPGSSTFGKYVDAVLSDKNHHILWIPAGFAHGFEVLSSEALMSYKCVGRYQAGYDTGICWDDTDIGIKWHTENPVVSDRDRQLQTLKQYLESGEQML